MTDGVFPDVALSAPVPARDFPAVIAAPLVEGQLTGFVGSWRIVEMELWGSDHVDPEALDFIRIGRDLRGQFGYGFFYGQMDCRMVERSGRPCIEFSWEGHDGDDWVNGRGWAQVAVDGDLEGWIFIHLGDDSGFRAVRTGATAIAER